MNIAIGFFFVIGVLVFFHELGHFLIAKWSGVRVEKFSLGFGKKLIGFTRGETEYRVSILPLGGYVKMYGESGEGCMIIEDVKPGSHAEKSGFKSGDKLSKIDSKELKDFKSWASLLNKLRTNPDNTYEYNIERDDETIKINGTLDDIEGLEIYSEKEYKRGFSNVGLFKRFLIVIAGPMMNFFLPFVFFPIIFYIGIAKPSYLDNKPVVGYVQPDSSADTAGLMKGDTILKINGNDVSTWKDVNIGFQTNPDSIVQVTILHDGTEKTLNIKASASNVGVVNVGIFEPIDSVVGGVVDGTPADDAGLQKGDRITRINQTEITDWYQMSTVIKSLPDKESNFVINRNGKILNIKITPKDLQGNHQGQIGISPLQEQVIKKYPLIQSVTEGISEAAGQTYEITRLLLGFLYKLVTGQIPLSTAGKSIAGPFLIAKVSGTAAENGLATLLQFTSFISINLAIINLFPIPMLDGGHVLYIALEAIRRKPLNQKTLEYSQKIGFTFLILLMCLAIFNDLSRIKGNIIKPVKKAIEYIR